MGAKISGRSFQNWWDSFCPVASAVSVSVFVEVYQQTYLYLEAKYEVVLVSDDAQIDGGVAVFLDSGQQGGPIAVPDFPRMEVILWVQQLPGHDRN